MMTLQFILALIGAFALGMVIGAAITAIVIDCRNERRMVKRCYEVLQPRLHGTP